jgi:HAD superfamily hydrolase (TIGR01509 family)
MASLKSKYKYEYVITDAELDNYAGMEDDRVIAKINESLIPCDGVDAELQSLSQERKYHLAVVSSSALRRVQASLNKVGYNKYFKEHEVFSAADSLPIPTSKPDPAVYLHALKSLGKSAAECVAIEDSRSGAMAARAARIPTIGYSWCYVGEEQKRMHRVLEDAGCLVIMKDWREFRACLAKIEY